MTSNFSPPAAPSAWPWWPRSAPRGSACQPPVGSANVYAIVPLALAFVLSLCCSAAGAQTAKFHLVDIDIRHAAAAVSHFTGKRVRLAPEVHGKVSMVGEHNVDAYQAITWLFAVAQDSGWQPEIDPGGSLYIRAGRFSDSEMQVVRRVHQVRGGDAAVLASRVRPLLSAQGSIGAPDAHRLLVLDIASVQAKVARLIESQAEPATQQEPDREGVGR